MKRVLSTVLAHFVALVVLTGCGSAVGPDLEPDLPAVHLGTYTAPDFTLDAYADTAPGVGYHAIYLDVRHAGGAPVNAADIVLKPIMTMTAHSHASPVSQPGHSRGDSGLFEGAVVFTMPSGELGSWRLEIDVTDQATGGSASFTVPVSVAQTSNVRVVTAADDERYVITYVEPRAPKVGLNDLVLAIHRRESMMAFPAVTDLRIEIEPWMPSMDHGSHNNVHPVHAGSGLYFGKVNFNMSGDWRIHVRVLRGDALLIETHFDLLFH